LRKRSARLPFRDRENGTALPLEGQTAQEFLAAYLANPTYSHPNADLRKAWRRLADEDVLTNRLALPTLLSQGSVFLLELLLGLEFACSVLSRRGGDKEEQIDGIYLVDRIRSREDHPCVGLLQINPYELCGDGSSYLFIYTVLENCARFVPKIVNEHPEAARNLCPFLAARESLNLSLFVPLSALCPAEFEVRFIQDADEERYSKLVSDFTSGLVAMYRPDRLTLVNHILSENLSDETRGLFRSVCDKVGFAESLPDMCALVRQLGAPRVKPATGGTVRK
jgi:hypothetical protein